MNSLPGPSHGVAALSPLNTGFEAFPVNRLLCYPGFPKGCQDRYSAEHVDVVTRQLKLGSKHGARVQYVQEVFGAKNAFPEWG